jgi:RNA polymerase sigma factor (sigma-70 family)
MKSTIWKSGRKAGTIPDEALYHKIKKEDPDALDYVYTSFFPLAKAEFGMQIRNADELKDIFQDSVIALWQNIKNDKYQLRSSTKLSSYLLTIMRYRWIEKIRSGKTKHEVQLPQGFDVQLNDPDAATVLIQAEQNEKLIRHFNSLGEKCQFILQEFYYNKKSLSEIAEELNMQSASVKNEKYRCMQKLRIIINSENR